VKVASVKLLDSKRANKSVGDSREMLLEAVLANVNQYVAQLQSPIPLPQTKLIVTQPNEREFSIFFCDSRMSYTTAATTEAFISEVRQHYPRKECWCGLDCLHRHFLIWYVIFRIAETS
jgi:hypothetical protein